MRVRMTSAMSLCVGCDEAISNPLCTSCLSAKMRMVVGEYDQKLAAQITAAEIPGETICVRCNKGMGLCAHCFSKDVYEFLQAQNPFVAKEFSRHFDFQIRQKLAEFS